MRKLSLYLFGTLFLLGVGSCSEDFLETTDRNSINSASFYSNAEEMVQAVNAVYAGLQNQGLYQRSIFFLLDFSSDEIAPTQNTQQPPQALLDYSWGTTNEHIVNFWRDNFLTIARANTVIEKLPQARNLEDALARRVEAEAKALRGLAYLNLVVNYGGVPLRVAEDPDSKNLTNWPRATPAEIYAQVESDLNYARENLPTRSQYAPEDNGRITSGAANALLGRALVYQEKWAEAEQVLETVVSSGEYELISIEDLRNQFNGTAENSAETIFEVQFATGLGEGGEPWAVDVNTGWGGNTEGTFRPKEYGIPSFFNARASQSLVDAFEEGDARKATFLYGPDSDAEVGGLPYGDSLFATFGWGIRKYAEETPGRAAPLNDGFINAVVIRYAEVLLLLAEAELRQSKTGEAIERLNQIRDRAGLDPLAAGVDVEAALIQERRVELCFECHRRIDIVRWGLGPQILGNKFTPSKHEVFPIPQGEVDTNFELGGQNPGY